MDVHSKFELLLVTDNNTDLLMLSVILHNIAASVTILADE